MGGSWLGPLVVALAALAVAAVVRRSRRPPRVSDAWLRAWRQGQGCEYEGVAWRWPVRDRTRDR